MFQLLSIFFVSISSTSSRSAAQLSPPPTSYDTSPKSPIAPSITISYREPELCTCTTASTSQYQYTGYIDLAPLTLELYRQGCPTSTSFRFFKAGGDSDITPLPVPFHEKSWSSSMVVLLREMEGKLPNRTIIRRTGINLFAENYGDQYGHISPDFFESQNDRRRTDKVSANETLEVKLLSPGMIHGLMDSPLQTLSTFGTHRTGDSVHKNNVLPQPKNSFWIQTIEDTCTEEEERKIHRGLDTVENVRWLARDRPVTPRADELDEMSLHERPTTTSIISRTGIFTATATPIPNSGASQVSFRLHRRQVPHQVGNRFEVIAKEANSVKYGLIGGLAGVAGLLLLLSVTALGCLGWRRHRSKKFDRRFLGGPRRTPSPLPTSKPATESDMKLKGNAVQRVNQVQPIAQKEPDCVAARYDIEKPQLLPILDRRSTRRASAPMEPIPEMYSPRPSGDMSEHHLREFGEVPVAVERDARTPSPSSSIDQLRKALKDSLEGSMSHTSTLPTETSISHSTEPEPVMPHASAPLDPSPVIQKQC